MRIKLIDCLMLFILLNNVVLFSGESHWEALKQIAKGTFEYQVDVCENPENRIKKNDRIERALDKYIVCPLIKFVQKKTKED